MRSSFIMMFMLEQIYELPWPWLFFIILWESCYVFRKSSHLFDFWTVLYCYLMQPAAPTLHWFTSAQSSSIRLDYTVVLVQSLSHVQLYDPTNCSTSGFPVLHFVPGFAQTQVHWVNDAIQLSHPLSPPSPALNLSQHQGFSNEFALCIRWPKYWSSINPSNEYSGFISFRINWFDLLAVQGTLKSLLQHHNSKASILQRSAFFSSLLSMTIGKTAALTIRTFVSKVLSLRFNTLSRFVIAFLPRSKHLLILWLQSPTAVILEPKIIKFVTVSTFSPPICHVWILKGSKYFISQLNVDGTVINGWSILQKRGKVSI